MNRRSLLGALFALPVVPLVAKVPVNAALAQPEFAGFRARITLADFAARLAQDHADELLYGTLTDENPLLFDLPYKRDPDNKISVSFRRIN